MRAIAFVAVSIACSACGSPEPPPRRASAIPTLRLAEGVAPLAYDLKLEIDPAKPEFRGEVAIRIRIDAPTAQLWLHAGDLAITEAHYDGGRISATVTYPHQLLRLELDHSVGPGEVVVHLAYSGRTTRDQEGLFRQRHDGSWFVFSQGESVFARQIVPCFDEPRFKVPWRVTLTVPGTQVALSNAPVAEDRKLPDGRREVRFQEIAALPSYLLAVAVGPFVLIDGGAVGRAKTPFRIAAWRGARQQAAFALATTPKLVEAFERYFDQAIPLAKLDLVAVPELFGAMEHPGLVTFDSTILLGDRDDDEHRRRYIRVSAHELAHQWTGNLVTPAWWDDLWLSEAFATFLGDKISADLGGFDDAPLRTQIDREDALAADDEARPRALRHPIAEGDDIDETFDAIAYEKGAAVLAMFEQHIGPGQLQAALRSYIAAHAQGSVTTADLVAAISAVSSPTVGQALASHVDHRGTPIVELAVRCSGAPVLVAHARDGVIVPICVRFPTTAGAARSCALVGDRTEVQLTAASTCPAWVIGNADGRGYYQIAGQLPEPPLAVSTPAERLAHGDDLSGAVNRGELAVPAALTALAGLAASPDPYALLAATRVASAIDPLIDDRARAAWMAWLATKFSSRLTANALFRPSKVVDHELRDALLALVPAEQLDASAVRRARRFVDRALAARGPDPGTLELTLSIAAPRGGAKLFERVLARARTTEELDVELADTLIEGLGGFGPELAERVVALVVDRSVRRGPAVHALATMLSRPSTRAAAGQAVHGKLAGLFTGATRPELELLAKSLGDQCDRPARDAIAAELEPHVAEIIDGKATLDRMFAGIDRCIRRRAAAGDVAAALRRWSPD